MGGEKEATKDDTLIFGQDVQVRGWNWLDSLLLKSPLEFHNFPIFCSTAIFTQQRIKDILT